MLWPSIGSRCAGMLLLLLPLVSQAHVSLERSLPASNSQVSPPPDSIQLWYNGAVEAAWSRIEVADASGTRVHTGTATHIGNDNRSLRIGLKPLPSGAYTVKWNSVARDGHRIKGTFSFSVK